MNMADVQMQLTRLKRADNLGLELSERIQEWAKENLEVQIQISADRKSWYLELHVKEDPDLDAWSMIFSDAVGQLRNTLDNLVYSTLTPLADSENLPKNPKLIKFPIVSSEADWKSGSKGIEHIPEPYYSRIKSTQPFNQPKEKNSQNSMYGLLALQALSNEDKHQLQIIPEINTVNINHQFSLEFETIEGAVASLPPIVEILEPVFKEGSHLLRQKTKGHIKSVNGQFRVEAKVMVKLGEGQMGIVDLLAQLWEFVANALVYVADLPKEDFENWANNL